MSPNETCLADPDAAGRRGAADANGGCFRRAEAGTTGRGRLLRRNKRVTSQGLFYLDS